jgi:acylphosphatase
MGEPREGRSAFHATISGLVQGVGFRYSACREARRLAVSGWVRNLPDGDVEILAEGEDEALSRFLEWLKEGPEGSRVRSVKSESVASTGYYSGFTIEY